MQYSIVKKHSLLIHRDSLTFIKKLKAMRYKLLFFFLLIFSNYPMSGEEQIINVLLSRGRIATRSSLSLPRASIDDYKNLTISFESSGTYTLLIKYENTDDIAFSSLLPADGNEYSYDLTALKEGNYCLILDGPSGEYEGYFFLY